MIKLSLLQAGMLLVSLMLGQTSIAQPANHGKPRVDDAEAISPCLKILGTIVTYDLSHPEGPRLYVKPPFAANTKLPEHAKIGSFNVENLLDYQGQKKFNPATGKEEWTDPPYHKPPERLDQVVDVEQRTDDDMGFWIEVEGMEPAVEVSQSRLGGKYGFINVLGNDERGIQIMFKFRWGLPFWYELRSHRNLKIKLENGEEKWLFSRDLPMVLVRLPHMTEADAPLMILVGMHLKSQRDSLNDPRSVKYRTAQVREAIKIILEYQKQYPDTPIFMMGDFNADIRTAEEFKQLWVEGFKDSFDLEQAIALADRITQMFFPNGGEGVFSQLDGAILSPSAIAADILLAAKIIPYLNKDGSLMAIPKTFNERLLQGSDHRKIQIIIDLAKLLKEKNIDPSKLFL